MSGRVAGKKALITVAAQGIGAATARLLARARAQLLLTELNEAGAVQTSAALEAEFGAGCASAMRLDVTNEADWVDAIGQARVTLGGLSVLLNNAGIVVMGNVDELDLEAWRKGMAIKLDNVLLGTKHALRLMPGTQPGSIVNLSSIASVIATDIFAYKQFESILQTNLIASYWFIRDTVGGMIARRDCSITLVGSISGLREMSFMGAFNIAKAVEIRVTRSLALEFEVHNACVNCFIPGLVSSDCV